MLFTASVQPDKLLPLNPDEKQRLQNSPDLLERVRIPRSTIPAVTHLDNSARLQTVDQQRNPRLHALLTAFERLTGCPVLVNTSFNVRGEPIVCTPDDALACFQATGLDVLVLQNFLIHDKSFPPLPARARPKHCRPQPTLRTLRQFAVLCCLLALATAAECLRRGLSDSYFAVSTAAALLALPGIFRPLLAKPLFSGLLLLTAPLRWVTSRLLLFTIYFAVVCPIGLLQRCLRHDPLQLRDNTPQSFWKGRPGSPSSALRPW
jgi:hypothetical protein